MTAQLTGQRTLTRITTKQQLGPDAQVDDKALVFVPALGPGATYDLQVPAGHRLFAHVMNGHLLVGGRDLHAGRTGWSDPVIAPVTGPAITTLHLAAVDPEKPARVMVYSGTPLREPVAVGGPFVMNTKVEITKAFTDFHAGTFGPVPRTARLGGR